MALILTALAVGQIEYENALALAIGANVGTTITAILGSLSANIAGKRLAGAHFVFNFITGLVAIAFIFQLADLVTFLSSVLGIGETNYTLKLALFHTLFNLYYKYYKKVKVIYGKIIKYTTTTQSKHDFTEGQNVPCKLNENKEHLRL